MAARKPGQTKNRKKTVRRNQKKSLLIPVIIAGVFVLTAVAAFVVLVVRPYKSPDENIIEPHAPISYEEPGLPHTVVPVEPLDRKEDHTDSRVSEDYTPGDEEKPLVAIVIDDMGYQHETGKKLLDMDLNLSFAFLPSGPYLEILSKKAVRNGRDVLLHFPLEPADSRWNPGSGALFISMSHETMRSQFEKNLSALPQAKGVNNHMGSRFTQNRDAMKFFLEMVRENDLYFLDSMTSRNSLGHYMAREMGIRTARRHVFLDNIREKRKIKKQLRHLLEVAEKKGWAIGIGHPYGQTMAALEDLRLEINRRCKLIGVSQMVH